jgi:glycosyltransferase involved in cell wall biosynthesis
MDAAAVNRAAGAANGPPDRQVVVFAAYGVHPPRSAGHHAVLWPLRLLAQRGWRIDLVTPGLRRFERRWPCSFSVDVEPRLVEHRLVSPLRLLRELMTGRARLPPVDLSDFLERRLPADLRAAARAADLVQIESPWAFPMARAATLAPIVFVAHNVELDLHEKALAAHGQALVERARAIEARAWRESDLVFVFLAADAARFEARYGPRSGPVVVQPIATDVRGVVPADGERRMAARIALGLPREATVAVFAASAHAPNVEAARFLRGLAAELPEGRVHVLLAGSVCRRPETFPGGSATGPLPWLDDCFAAADLALNPVATGSGMNLKVADCLAWGLPVLATGCGGRGFATGDDTGLLVAERAGFAASLLALAGDPARRATLARAARAHAERELSWDSAVAVRVANYPVRLSDPVGQA